MKLVANILTILGGAWTSLCGVLLLGLLLDVAGDPSQVSGPNSSFVVSPLVWTAVALVAGIAMFTSGLRLMRRR